MRSEDNASEPETPLVDGEKLTNGGTVTFMDWLGRPADDRRDLGGWRCASCIIGAYFFVFSAYFGVTANLVLYLINDWGKSNGAAASDVSNLFGTTLLCSFLGGFVSDGYTGRLWGAVIFEIILILSFLSISSIGTLTVNGLSSEPVASRALLLASLYLMAVASGSIFPTLTSLGADQFRLQNDKARYFTVIAMAVSAGQIFATTVITYLDGREEWDFGFWLCTATAGVALISTLCAASTCRVQRTGGNALVRVGQVLVAAMRNWDARIPEDRRLLHEVEGEISAIPGCRKLPHTESLRCLDKAAVTSDDGMRAGSWQLCTVTQVEEVKCLMRVMPVGIAPLCVGVALAQVTTLFEEQAAATNGKLVGSLSIAPASMQLFYVAGALLTGLLHNAIDVFPLTKCLRCCKDEGVTSLQLQGIAILVSIAAMVESALVEAYRLHVANDGGSLISVSWLIPQNFLLGISTNLAYAGRYRFFYDEVSNGMRATGVSLSFLFSGASNYLNSVFIVAVTAVGTTAGSSGWIADDLNEGHLDYFYWFIACFLSFSLGLYLLYAHFYTYRDDDTSRNFTE